MLYEAARERAKNPPKPRWREVCETFHDYVLFMGNTGLRPDESPRRRNLSRLGRRAASRPVARAQL